MSKLLVVLLSLIISSEASAFGKKAETAKPHPAPVAATQAPVTIPVTAPLPSTTKPIKAAPVAHPKAPVKASIPTPEQEAAIENLNQDDYHKPPAEIKKVEKKVKPKPAPPVISAAKKQELETLAFLKKDAMCGASTTRGVSTTGSAHSYYRISNVYSRENAPESVKKLIEKQVDECDQITKVGKYYVKPVAQATPVAAAPATQNAEDVVNESAKKVGDFFNKLGTDMKNNGVKEKTCSASEQAMHTNGC